VRVDGERATQPTVRIRAGAVLSFEASARRPRRADLAEDAVVYVDPHVVLVSKPAGVSTIPYLDRESADPHAAQEGTLDAMVRAWLARRPGSTRSVRPNLGVVHRLDKETTGLVVFTRTWLAKQSLASQFRKHSVHRRYLAIAHGDVRSQTIRSFLVEDRGDGRRGSARGEPPPSAREAVTHVECIERLHGATLVACRLETGRTHQIRVHLSEAGNPLLGERVYLGHGAGPAIEAPRLMLHACALGFVHPATGRAVGWEQPMPADMRSVLERLRQ
jgi:23S rRNA pseudouridine1911/1915/1917 synthase